MNLRTFTGLLAAAAAVAAGRLCADEPGFSLEPLIFNEPSPEGGRVAGFRPFYVKTVSHQGETAEITVLYPLFYYRSYGDVYTWSLFDLINRYGEKGGGAPTEYNEGRTFDIWPIYFSRETGDPATSYRGLLPLAGDVQGHLFYDKMSWVLFPLYARAEKRGTETTFTPWPIIRSITGAENGFAVWPLFGRTTGPGVASHRYFLWPLVWNNTVPPRPDAGPGAGPTRQVGFLPFYTSEAGSGFRDVTYLWPFFGSNDRTAPYRYHETDYFWPFLVQGRGDDRYVNRWGPFYTHSDVLGMDKTWVLWPLIRHTAWTDGDVADEKTQFLYFVYWDFEQHRASNPAAAPARKHGLWPLFFSWDNGAGHRQTQILDPLEVFFTSNDEVRESWTPYFALYRRDERAPGDATTSLLWGAVSWSRHASEGRSELKVGPFRLEFGPKPPSVSSAVR